MTSPYTLARQSVWDAIDNYADTANAFKQKFRSEGDLPEFSDGKDPHFVDMPAIAVWSVSSLPDWWTNKQQKLPLLLEVRIWTSGWELEEAEDLAYKVRAAIWDAKPSPSANTYVKTATGFHPESVRTPSFLTVGLGQNKSEQAVRTTIIVALQMRDDPLT